MPIEDASIEEDKEDYEHIQGAEVAEDTVMTAEIKVAKGRATKNQIGKANVN